MKLVTNTFKNKIKQFGRQFDCTITYYDGQTHEIEYEQINSISVHYDGDILKSIMRQVDIDSNIEIPVGSTLSISYGIKTKSGLNPFEYVNLGRYNVIKCEKQEDTNSYIITAYDDLIKSMVEYANTITVFPITVSNYLTSICGILGITIESSTLSNIANANKTIQNELYLDNNGNSLGYTFRDVLDEISAVVGGNIWINPETNKLEIKYIDIQQKNKLNIYDGFDLGYINSSNEYVPDVKNALFKQKIPVEAGVKYTFSVGQRIDNMVVTVYDASDNYITRSKSSNVSSKTYTIPNNASYVRLAINYNNSSTMTEEIILNLKPMVEKGNSRTNYVPYPVTIDEENLKNINVKFGKKFGKVNSVVLSRSAESDNVYLRDEDSVLANGLCEIKIVDNQIMNGNDRSEYLQGILDKVDGMEFYINDYSSRGMLYLEAMDIYNVKIGEQTYLCTMFNDEVNITQGLEELVFTNEPEITKTDYTKADKTDRKINQTTLIVDKQNGIIQGVVESVNQYEDRISRVETKQTDQEFAIDIISKNINPVTGEVESVKTTKGYTFDANGLGISSTDSAFGLTIDNIGVFFKNRDTIIGQFTKDNIIIKDLVLFGREYYGVNKNIDVANFTKDDAMFVGEKYTDDRGSVGYGHFYNGG